MAGRGGSDLEREARTRRVGVLGWARVSRRLVLVAVAVLVVGLAVVSSAGATSLFYWYGEGNSTCWADGRAGRAGIEMRLGGGDLCRGARLPVGVDRDRRDPQRAQRGLLQLLRNRTAAVDRGFQQRRPSTGFTTPTPYQSYQQADGYGNVCQGAGSSWGWVVTHKAPGNNCFVTCGMRHYVSFHEQGTNLRPWSSQWANSILVLSAYANPQIFSTSSKDAGGWGYVCPILDDVTTGNYLEYCLQEWHSEDNEPVWNDLDFSDYCQSASGINIDLLITQFNLGTQFATEKAGLTNTYVLKSPGNHYFTAGITKEDLLNAIVADEKSCPRPPHSHNPADYALVGIEQGQEGWRNMSEIAGSASNLQLYSEYTPYPAPEATTGPGVW